MAGGATTTADGVPAAGRGIELGVKADYSVDSTERYSGSVADLDKCGGGQIAEVVLEMLKQADKVAVGAGFELVKEGLYLIVGRFGGSRSGDGVGLIHALDASNKQHFHRVAYSVGR